jgi:ubiquinone/menaquinone biosynthesis C-methylase UbiE
VCPEVRGAHWDRIYAGTSSDRLSWYEREPATSLRLITAHAPGLSASVIDIGAGMSTLADRLLDRGFTDVTVLDISDASLAQLAERLGDRARAVALVRADVLAWQPERSYDVWHDRAVFHFLTSSADRDRYVAQASRVLQPGGSLVLATFAEDGPQQCSGLPVAGYAAGDLATVFAAAFALIDHEREEHVTPGGVVQPFTWVVLQRSG